jgi:hypothetical protein
LEYLCAGILVHRKDVGCRSIFVLLAEDPVAVGEFALLAAGFGVSDMKTKGLRHTHPSITWISSKAGTLAFGSRHSITSDHTCSILLNDAEGIDM